MNDYSDINLYINNIKEDLLKIEKLIDSIDVSDLSFGPKEDRALCYKDIEEIQKKLDALSKESNNVIKAYEKHMNGEWVRIY